MSLDSLVAEWLRLDRNPTTRKEIEDLHQAANYDELAARLSKRISFGTAGLRAHMSAGFSRMNDVTVIQASQGLAGYLAKDIEDATQMGIVIGHDHRHNSTRFARLATVAFLKQGFKCYLLDGLAATPLVPFAVRYLGAAAGVMITASHNPAADNGYKLYYSDGVQISSPHDKAIAASIEQHLEIDADAWNIDITAHASEKLQLDSTQDIKEMYFQALGRLVTRPKLDNSQTPVVFVYTAMHGVGQAYASRAFEGVAGFPAEAWRPVRAQEAPDPAFPTVRFPNPEEAGALDLAIQAAQAIADAAPGQTVAVLANDPDADRFCAAEWARSKWTVFSGDQIGAILACWILEGYKKSGQPLDRLAMLSSTVSSRLVAQIAHQEGFKFEETLTGFKNIGHAALALHNQGYAVVFAYEEALGYMFQSGIFDKDGIAAIVVWAQLASDLAQRGSSVSAYLESIYKTYGYFVTNNGYFVCKDPNAVKSKFHQLRYGDDPAAGTSGGSSGGGSGGRQGYPAALGGDPVTRVRDLTVGYDGGRPPGWRPALPASADEMVTFYVGGPGGPVTATLRASGTESWKLKYYVEGRADDPRTAQDKVDRIVRALAHEWGFAHL